MDFVDKYKGGDIATSLRDVVETSKITDKQRAVVIAHKEIFIRLINDIISDTILRFINGEVLKGFKVVESVKRKKWMKGAKDALIDDFGDGIVEEKLISVSRAEELFGDGVNDYVEYGKSKLELVSDSDPRPSAIIEQN